MLEWIEKLYGIIWGAPTLCLILGTGLLVTWRTAFAQARLLPLACRRFFGREGRSATGDVDVSSFRALCTALAATVGIGNLAGVAGAIALGGPGAVFWMWISGFLGMGVKFAEATLAVRFRRRDGQGRYLGGPMYMIEDGMGRRWRFLGAVYCFFGVAAAFGVGNATQINAVIVSIRQCAAASGRVLAPQWNLWIGLALAGLIGAVLLGGAGRIAATAEKLVPFAAGGYILLCLAVLVLRAPALPGALRAIVLGAFSPRAVTGGAVGSAAIALRTGISRGVFTNEAGMGTASISHAGAAVSHPVEQGLMGIMEVFLDTMVICTMTALVILCSGVQISYGTDEGAALTGRAFSLTLGPWAGTAVTIAICLFAVATVLGWGLYGARCAQYLFGDGIWRRYAWLQTAAVALGALVNTATLWRFAEIVNGLMAIPNLLALWALCPVLRQLNQQYNCGRASAAGGTYENIHQCEPL